MMKFRFLLLLFVVFQFGVSAQNVVQSDLRAPLLAYMDTVKKLNKTFRGQYFIVIRFEGEMKDGKLFLTSSDRLSNILSEGAPESYFMLNNQLIFQYSRSSNRYEDSRRKEAFISEFKRYFDFEDTLGLSAFEESSYLYWISKGRIARSRTLCGFPFPSYYDMGKTFDSEGNLIYLDGIYHTCNVRMDEPKLERSPMELVRKATDDSLSHKSLGAELVIDERGVVVSAKIDGKDHESISEKTEKELAKLLLGMRRSRGFIDKKPVKYRVFVVL